MHPIIAKIADLGQAIWCDDLRRSMIVSGELQRLIDDGIAGMTSNPTIFQKGIGQSRDYENELGALIDQGLGPKEIYEALAFEDIRRACDLFEPLYRGTDRRHGFVSIEVPPSLAHDTEATIEEARRIHAAIGRPNVMVKVPATDAGLPAIEALIGDGINVNITLIFSIDMYRRVIAAYLGGLERLHRAKGDLAGVASVASFFVSRVDTLVDKLLSAKIEAGRPHLAAVLGKSAVANAKLAYQAFKQEFAAPRFAALEAHGARVQRPLWASTSTKNAAYPDLLYVDNLVGADTVNTMPLATLDALCDHGRAEPTLEQELDGARAVLACLEEAGIHMPDVTEQLKLEGIKLFADSFDDLLGTIESKKGSGALA